MPELPEVEVTRLGLVKRVRGKKCTGAVVRETRFRKPAPENLNELLSEATLIDIRRRGKYLIWIFDKGTLLSHLGMSGTLRVYEQTDTEVSKHDHIDLLFGDLLVRYRDPRRFGFVIYKPSLASALSMPELTKLGVEPLTKDFNPKTFYKELRKSTGSIKEALLSGKHVVGVGNIYCSESLFLAGIRPTTKANKISLKRISKLVDSIKEVLQASIELGGSTLKDFVSSDGSQGYYTLNNNVYGREGLPCKKCGSPIKKIVQNGRSTFFCPNCQKR